MSIDSESDARKGKEERRKQVASRKKKKLLTEYEDTDDGDDESENTEERRYRKDAEKRLQNELKRLRKEKRLNQAKDKKKATVMDIDSESLRSKEHIPPQVSTHRSNLMVRQNIDDLDSESGCEPSVKQKKKVPTVETEVNKQDNNTMSKRKTNMQIDDNQNSKGNKEEQIVSRVARRQTDTEYLSDASAVIMYKKREKEREKKNNKLKTENDDESDRKPASKPVIEETIMNKKIEKEWEKKNKKLKNDTDDESDRKPASKPVIEENNHRRSPRIKKKKVKKMNDVSDSLSENDDDDKLVHPESIEDEANSNEDDEDSLDSENCEYDTDNRIPAVIPFFRDDNVWDWSQYVTNVVGEREVTIISKDEFPQKGSIKLMSVRKYMIRKGWDETNKRQQVVARQRIALTLKNCKNTVKNWLNRFLVDFAPHCDILCQDKTTRRTRLPRNLPELHDAISHYERIEDVYKVFNLLLILSAGRFNVNSILYLSFSSFRNGFLTSLRVIEISFCTQFNFARCLLPVLACSSLRNLRSADNSLGSICSEFSSINKSEIILA